MASEGSFGLFAIDDLWTGPAFGRAQNDHRPGGSFAVSILSGGCLNAFDLGKDIVKRRCQLLMHGFRVVTGNEIWAVAVSLQQLVQFIFGNPRQHRRIRDLISIQMQDGQHRAITRGIEKFVRVPARRQRAGFGFTVADHASCNQIRIIEDRAECMRHAITQFTALMDRPRRFRRDVARNAAGKRELLEQLLHPALVLCNVRVNLTVGAFEVRVCNQARSAMTWAGDVNHIQVALANDPIQVNIDQVQSWRGAPMTQQPPFDVIPF